MSDKTREEFEEWCRSNDGFVQADLSKVGGEYCTGFMQCSYASWQAAKELYAPRAAMSQKQEAEPVFMWHKGATDEESEVVDVDCACECCVPLYTAPPSTAQDGMVMVPVEPTEELVNAIDMAMRTGTADDAYKAMLKAASKGE